MRYSLSASDKSGVGISVPRDTTATNARRERVFLCRNLAAIQWWAGWCS
ncbi:MAG: hypothetical protein ACL7AY_15670 [Candidatus Arsenophonus phytopathogenicus]